MNVGQSRSDSNNLQFGLKVASKVVLNTYSFERLLNVIYKSLKFYSRLGEVMNKASNSSVMHLTQNLRFSCDILLTSQSVSLAEELACPDKKWPLFFSREPWLKCANRIFLAIYSFFSGIQLAAKIGLINLKKIGDFAIRRLSIFKLISLSSYACYCSCKVIEGFKKKDWFKAATSSGKIICTIASLAFEALNFQSALGLLALSGVSLTIDALCFGRLVCLCKN